MKEITMSETWAIATTILCSFKLRSGSREIFEHDTARSTSNKESEDTPVLKGDHLRHRT